MRVGVWFPLMCLVLFAGASLAVVSCGDDPVASEQVCDNGQDDDGDGRVDCADPDCGGDPWCEPLSDAGVDQGRGPDQGARPGDAGPPDAPQGDALQQHVVSKIMLPTVEGEFGVDVDGKGNKNKLGTILSSLSVIGFDFQAELDAIIDAGNILVLLELFGESLTDEPDATLQALLGFDLDDEPSNNFSGLETFGISSNSPDDTILRGTITAGDLAVGSGKMVLPLPLEGPVPLVLTLEKASITGKISGSGLADGIIGGALPESEMQGTVLPAVAELLNALLGSTQVNDATKKQISDLLDGNDGKPKDGVITAEDISGSVLGLVIQPDVDTDGDGKPDALSAGVGVTAVTCKIQR